MTISKSALRKRAQSAFELEYCFSPALNQIILLEASGDGSRILCSVGYFEYEIIDLRVVDKRPLYD